jgi:hypothetical protein
VRQHLLKYRVTLRLAQQEGGEGGGIDHDHCSPSRARRMISEKSSALVG